MKTILITGGDGFIGRNLRERWAGRCHILSPSHAELDFTDQAGVEHFFSAHPVNAVVHCAIKPGHRAATDTSGVLLNDLLMYLHLRRSVVTRDIPLYVLGSGACYDTRYPIVRASEDDLGIHIPKDETGLAKYLISEDILRSSKTYDLRLFGVYGPYEAYAIRFISNALCKALYGLPITLRQDRIFDYVYTEDVAELIWRMLEVPPAEHAYHVTPDTSVSLLQLAEWVREITRAKVPIQVAQPGRGLEYTGSNARLRALYPDFQFTDIREGIRRLADYCRAHLTEIDRERLLTDL